MPTQEQINAAQVELDIANDNYARLADRYNRYNQIFDELANSSPEVREKAKGLIDEAMTDYKDLRNQMYAAEDRIAVAQNAVNAINEQIAAAQYAAEQAALARQTRRRVVPNPYQEDTSNGGGGGGVNWDDLPDSIKSSIDWSKLPNNTIIRPGAVRTPEPGRDIPLYGTGTLSAGDPIDAWDYVKGAWHGATDTFMNPNALVYGYNSREPGYNFGEKIGRLGTVGSLLYGGLEMAAPRAVAGTEILALPNKKLPALPNKAGTNWRVWDSSTPNRRFYDPAVAAQNSTVGSSIKALPYYSNSVTNAGRTIKQGSLF